MIKHKVLKAFSENKSFDDLKYVYEAFLKSSSCAKGKDFDAQKLIFVSIYTFTQHIFNLGYVYLPCLKWKKNVVGTNVFTRLRHQSSQYWLSKSFFWSQTLENLTVK